MISTLILLVCSVALDANGDCQGTEQQWLRKQWEGPTARTTCELMAMDSNQTAKRNEKFICDHGAGSLFSLQQAYFAM